MSNIEIPLEFWFTPKPNPKSIMNGNNILEKYDTLARIECKNADIAVSHDEIAKILDNLYNLENECVFKWLSREDSGLALPMIHPRPQPLFEHIEYVKNLLMKFTPTWYMIPIKMSKTEQINGYYLYDTEQSTELTPFMRYDIFLKLESLLNDTNKMTNEQFLEKYENEISFEWSKFNKHGEYITGAHQNFDDYLNECELTKNENGKALYDLPYSHAIIFETIRYGFTGIHQCPRFTNYICEYVIRKLKNRN